MRHMILAPAAAAIVLSGCALPSRDNPHDTSNLPTVSAELRDYTPEIFPAGTTCPEYGDTNGGEVTALASRGRCLAIVASAEDRDRNILTTGFRYTLVANENETDGEVLREVHGDPTSQLLTSPLAILSPAFRRDPERYIDKLLHVRVEVTDARRAVGHTVIDFVLTNEAPVAVVGPARSIPLGGYPFAFGLAINVDFHCDRSYDPDGDPFTLHWSDGADPAWTATCAGGTNAVVTRITEVGGRGRRDLIMVVASDGVASSAPRFEAVSIREPTLWVDAGNFVFEELDVGIFEIPYVNGVATSAATSVTLSQGSSGVPAVVAAFQLADMSTIAATLRVVGAEFDHDFAEPVVTGSTPSLAVVGRPDTSVIWAVAEADGFARRFTLEQGSQTLTLIPDGGPVPVDFPTTDLRDHHFAVDDLGQLWFATRLDITIQPSDTEGRLTVIDTADPPPNVVLDNDSLFLTALASRPGRSEMWTTSIPHTLGNDAAIAPGVRIWDTGTATMRYLSVGSSGAAGLAFASEDLAWISVPPSLRLIDVNLLEASGLDAATLVDVEIAGGADSLVADPATWTCFASARDPQTGLLASVRVEPDGSVHLIPLQAVNDDRPPRNIGIDGVNVRLNGSRVVVSRAPMETGVENRFYAGGYAARDSMTGGLLIASHEPPVLQRIAEDGSELQRFTHVTDEQGATVSIPQLFSLESAPDGRSLWALTTNDELVFLDLATTPPKMSVVTETASAIIDGYKVSSPIPGQAPFAWSLNKADIGTVLGTFDAEDPTVIPVIESGTRRFEDRWEVAPATNDACIGLFDDTDNTFSFYRAPPPGGGSPLLVQTVAATVSSYGGATASPGEDRQCFFWTAEQTAFGDWNVRITGWKPGEAEPTLPSSDVTVSFGQYQPTDIIAVSDGRVWFSATNFVLNPPDQRGYIDIGSGGTVRLLLYNGPALTGGGGFQFVR